MSALDKKRRYNEKHRERVNANNREWRANNRERSRAIWLRYKAANREKILAHQRAFRLEHRERLAARSRDLRYNLAPGQYDEMLLKQKGYCAACGYAFKDEKPYIDHDHRCCPGVKSCGKCIRGLIHQRCNSVLGYVNDDPIALRCMAEYLNGFAKQT